MPLPSSCFITGTDTDAGKTFVASALLHAWRAQGLSAVGFKPVAAGARLHDGRLVNDDALALQTAGSAGFTLDEINPICLPEACAPHIAAELADTTLQLAPLVSACNALRSRAERIVVEGAGGFLVPLGDDPESPDMAQLAQGLQLPVLLVVGLRLGCLNHALLTQEAILSRGLKLAGWVGNTLDPAMPQLARNIATLQRLLKAPCLAVLPRSPSPLAAAQGWCRNAGVQLPPLAPV